MPADSNVRQAGPEGTPRALLSRTSPEIAIFLLLAAALLCLAFVLSGQYASGNIYADYSSQRTDRHGTAALYEALSKTRPAVSRNYTPLRAITASGADILVFGINPFGLSKDLREASEAAARKGNRVLIALEGGDWFFDLSNPEIHKYWQLTVGDARPKSTFNDPILRERAWFYFDHDAEWGDVRLSEGKAIAIERRFGAGSIALVASSYPFSNAGLLEARDLSLIDWALGRNRAILFDESHLGSVEEGTMIGLARQFRLQGFLFVLIVCALLFIWQSSAPFPPERSVPVERDFSLAAASASEGLRNLLTRHIAPDRIVSTCLAEWIRDRGRTASPEKLARMEEAAGRKNHPVSQWKEIRSILGGDSRK